MIFRSPHFIISYYCVYVRRACSLRNASDWLMWRVNANIDLHILRQRQCINFAVIFIVRLAGWLCARVPFRRWLLLLLLLAVGCWLLHTSTAFTMTTGLMMLYGIRYNIKLLFCHLIELKRSRMLRSMQSNAYMKCLHSNCRQIACVRGTVFDAVTETSYQTKYQLRKWILLMTIVHPDGRIKAQIRRKLRRLVFVYDRIEAGRGRFSMAKDWYVFAHVVRSRILILWIYK